MIKHSTIFYHSAIKNLYPDARNIRTPLVAGMTSPVFLADTNVETVVFKFNDCDMIQRNHTISQILRIADVPAPYTQTHRYLDACFETYQYCPDRTVFEHINANIVPSKLFHIFSNAMRVQYQMTKIDVSGLNLGTKKYFSDVLLSNLRNKLCTTKILPYWLFVRTMSRGGPQYLIHNDLHSKNMLATADGDLSRIIDLDAVAVGNETFATIMVLRHYPLANADELMEYYEDISHHKLNRPAISAALNLIRTLRGPSALCHGYVRG